VAVRSGNIIAGTINLVKDGKFFGRYWGAFEYVKNLHFETCYYRAIEYCIDNGIEYMEPGAGGGEFKFLRYTILSEFTTILSLPKKFCGGIRGFDPYIVSSVHYLRDVRLRKAVRDFLELERERNKEITDYLIANSALTREKKNV
jgi:hypothetical protein